MDEQGLKLGMRLAAIEYLLSKVYISMYLQSGARPDRFDQHCETFLEEAGKQVFPVNDPALSDLVSAEWQAAIEHLVKIQKDILGQLTGKPAS
jgi:hypothetical protein